MIGTASIAVGLEGRAAAGIAGGAIGRPALEPLGKVGAGRSGLLKAAGGIAEGKALGSGAVLEGAVVTPEELGADAGLEGDTRELVVAGTMGLGTPGLLGAVELLEDAAGGAVTGLEVAALPEGAAVAGRAGLGWAGALETAVFGRIVLGVALECALPEVLPSRVLPNPAPLHGINTTCPTRNASVLNRFNARSSATPTPYLRASENRVSPAATVCWRSGISRVCPTFRPGSLRLLTCCNAAGVVPKRRARLYSVSPGCTVYGAAHTVVAAIPRAAATNACSARCLMGMSVHHTCRQLFKRRTR